VPKFIVDIYAEGESDEWCENFINDQLDIISAGYVKVEKFTSTNNARQEIADDACQYCCNKEMCGTCLHFCYFKHSATSAVA